MPSPPLPAGSVTPGDLYVDRAERALWLGVQLSEDPSGVVLISDIVGFQTSLTTTLTNANAYTDAQVATRALAVHTHVAADITDFAAAVAAAIPPTTGVPSGVICMWSGLLTAIGVGALAGWALCDGSNGTPDLRDRFVIGAGNKLPGVTNSGANATVSAAGAHTPIIQDHLLTAAEMPAHAHFASLAGTGVTDTEPGHTHNLNNEANKLTNLGGGGIWTIGGGVSIGQQTITMSAAGAHNHNVTVSVSGNTGSAGGGTAHGHTASAVPDHQHNLTPTQIREATPYMALAYIMKL